ncbi:hypothetical protein XCR_3095 [Xanthomonas campestris pv. raphani 756C]|nr:hypothetical protein XCR_3095 [Xanthomonas campestris pv. raphani 756C]
MHLPRREQLQRNCMMQCIANVSRQAGYTATSETAAAMG